MTLITPSEGAAMAIDAQSPNSSKTPPLPPNVSNVVLGNLHIKPWYPSFYPEDIIGGRRTDWLYVCQWCFKYTTEIIKFAAHCKVCNLRTEQPPGQLIYQKDGYAIYEIDGEEHKLYAQNLSLFAKLFLETKSVFFDASTFLYYTLVLSDAPNQVVGFFSKEKMSWDNNNVACILVFPPWQRRALGQVLIAASYALGRQEGRFGGPERPLSMLGKKGYMSFWCGEIARFVLRAPLRKPVCIKDMSDALFILPEDLLAALKEMDVVETRRGHNGDVNIDRSKARSWAERHGVKMAPIVDENAFLSTDDVLTDGSLEDLSQGNDEK